MRIFVTGGTGYLGGHFCEAAVNRGHQLKILVRGQTPDWLIGPRTTFVRGDIDNLCDEVVSAAVACDAVVHLAWSGLPNHGENYHLERNLPAQKRFLASLLDAGVRHVLVAGTCMEYGKHSGSIDESTPCEPLNPYAQAKFQLFNFLSSRASQLGCRLQWARLFYSHGPRQHSGSLLSQLDAALDAGSSRFPMSGGEQVRDYMRVEDMARSLCILAEHPRCTGATNVCSGEGVRLLDVVMGRLKGRDAEGKIELELGHYAYSDDEAMAFWGSREKFDTYCGDSDEGTNP